MSRLLQFLIQRFDFLANALSFFICGLIGILLNVLILHFYSVEILGVFNQVYAAYILLSQFSAFGIHLATLRYVARYQKRWQQEKILAAALLLGAVCSCCVALITYMLLPFFAWLFASDLLSSALAVTLPGLFFFTLNKVLLAFINAKQALRSYAFFSALRFILILCALLLLVLFDTPGQWLASILTIAEVLLFPCLLVFSLRTFYLRLNTRFWSLVPLILRFSKRTALGNMLLDVNSRLDVLLLGVFSNDAAVGVYSFASTLAEGFNQFAAVLRAIENPKLTHCFQTAGASGLAVKIKQVVRSNYLLLFPLGVIGVCCYPFLVTYFDVNSAPREGVLVFQILLAGMTLGAGFLPLQTVFNQIGRPWVQTVHLSLFVACNAILNLVLIPLFGMYGAAIATAIAFILHPVLLLTILRKQVGIRLN